jgi:hypothetical protein
LEDRTTSQITAASVRWSVRSPASARDAWRPIEAQGDRAVGDAAWAAGGALLDKEYEDILDRELANDTPKLADDAPEEALLAAAVRITRDR